ncbi:MAG: helix-turn-helix transcriptional regulator [Acetobacteraceae bacterium]|nr:helix-turn-helix transcriptional regulator [Acetobacteraceae bacterium]MBV8590697.1 helix-turn-helix transcriptional regulator [Acetobacteraceae bacterium]
MTPERLMELLGTLHWSVLMLAKVLGAHETTVRRWVEGTTTIPPNVGEWLEKIAVPIIRKPQPTGWVPQRDWSRGRR